MRIRPADRNDLDAIMSIYAAARQYMREHGNGSQWGDTYPPRELILEDIEKGRCLVGVCEDGAVHFVFAFMAGEDPTYKKIYGGSWLNDREYRAIHRVASDGRYHGCLKECLDHCKGQGWDLRIDTHAENGTMRRLLKKNGFVQCGTIFLENGEPRIAYQYDPASEKLREER